MAQYTLIASRDAFDSKAAADWFELAGSLQEAGNEVTVFLVQNGVLSARRSGRSDALKRLADQGVKVLADSFSLQERGIGSDRLAAGVQATELDIVVDHMAEGRKVIWH